MTPELYRRLATLHLSVETTRTVLTTAHAQETETDYIRFMDIVRAELRSLRQMIEYIETNMNAQTEGETSIEEPKREAALPQENTHQYPQTN